MTEARYAAADCGGLRVTSVYVPNGRAVDDPQFPYKLGWLGGPAGQLSMIMIAGRPMVIMGDFNVARHDADVFDIAAVRRLDPRHRRTSGPALESIIDWGLVDVPARPGKNDRPFTYWDYRAGMFHKDLGMRIDYVLASPDCRSPTPTWIVKPAREAAVRPRCR